MGGIRNKQQFYVTFKSCGHLDNKHTVFGRVVGGHDVLDRIERVDVDAADDHRPLKDGVKILGTDVFVDPTVEADAKFEGSCGRRSPRARFGVAGPEGAAGFRAGAGAEAARGRPAARRDGATKAKKSERRAGDCRRRGGKIGRGAARPWRSSCAVALAARRDLCGPCGPSARPPVVLTSNSGGDGRRRCSRGAG